MVLKTVFFRVAVLYRFCCTSETDSDTESDYNLVVQNKTEMSKISYKKRKLTKETFSEYESIVSSSDEKKSQKIQDII